MRLSDEDLGWKHVATVLYNELKRWGWGDFHYGSQPQEKSVVAALAVYEQAINKERNAST